MNYQDRKNFNLKSIENCKLKTKLETLEIKQYKSSKNFVKKLNKHRELEKKFNQKEDPSFINLTDMSVSDEIQD